MSHASTERAQTDDPVRLILLGGFLGAGKTTTLLRLAAHYRARGDTVGVIANDQGDDLVDTARFRDAGLGTAEVTGGCFCCRFDDFVERADALIAAHRPAVLLAEPVGSCTDLVATVVNPLRRLFPGRFALAPFTVLVDPVRALDLLAKRASVSLSEKVTYIFRMQQQEADCVAINKIDLLSAAERERVHGLIAEQFPGTRVLAFSAHSGDGFDALVEWLETGAASTRLAPEVDYDVYAAGEAELGWLNRSATLLAAAAVDVDAAALDLAAAIGRALAAVDAPIAHAKLLVRGERRTAVASIVRSGAVPELSQATGERAAQLDVVVNLRAQTAPELIDRVLHRELAAWALRYHGALSVGAGSAFSPPRPVPTHRLAERGEG